MDSEWLGGTEGVCNINGSIFMQRSEQSAINLVFEKIRAAFESYEVSQPNIFIIPKNLPV